MKLIRILKYINKHPLNASNKPAATRRFIKWQLYNLFFPYTIIFPFTERARLIGKKGMTGAIGNLYCGLHEYEDMAFLLHFLRRDDTFADVGANVGSYSILAAAYVGSKTISIEPVPATFSFLKQNIAINQVEDRTTALNIGISSKAGILKFTKSFDTTNRVALPGETDTIDVQMDKLDTVLEKRTPGLMKIDVEGYETEVINGATQLLKDPGLKAIIMELGAGQRYGLDESSARNTLQENGFVICRYDPQKRELFPGERGKDNWLFIRDMAFVKERVKTADKVTINKVVF
jgi:FkbM family methyltransferase